MIFKDGKYITTDGSIIKSHLRAIEHEIQSRINGDSDFLEKEFEEVYEIKELDTILRFIVENPALVNYIINNYNPNHVESWYNPFEDEIND